MILTRRPSNTTIYNHGITIINFLYHKSYNNQNILYNARDIISLLNYISKDISTPNELKIPWGDAIQAACAAKTAVHKIGVKGNKLQQQTKQSIISSFIVLDENKNIINKSLINKIAPHKAPQCKRKYIYECADIRGKFNDEIINILCNNKEPFKRNSLVYCRF